MLSPVTRVPLSPMGRRHGHAQVKVWFPGGSRCHSEGASKNESTRYRSPHRTGRSQLAPPARGPCTHQGVTMKIIAKVIESMLSKDATQKWNGQTSAFEPNNVWHWNP